MLKLKKSQYQNDNEERWADKIDKKPFFRFQIMKRGHSDTFKNNS